MKISEELDKLEKRKKERQKQEDKKFRKPPKDTQKDQENSRVDALEFYNNLTEGEKVALSKEIERKKIRDSYIHYLKYVYPDFIITKFHALLANICQSVVEKVENGQTVRILLSVPFRHGKTTLVTKTLPSWFIGRNPDLSCIVTAYNADIAEKFGDRPRQTIKKYGKELEYLF